MSVPGEYYIVGTESEYLLYKTIIGAKDKLVVKTETYDEALRIIKEELQQKERR